MTVEWESNERPPEGRILDQVLELPYGRAVLEKWTGQPLYYLRLPGVEPLFTISADNDEAAKRVAIRKVRAQAQSALDATEPATPGEG